MKEKTQTQLSGAVVLTACARGVRVRAVFLVFRGELTGAHTFERVCVFVLVFVARKHALLARSVRISHTPAAREAVARRAESCLSRVLRRGPLFYVRSCRSCRARRRGSLSDVWRASRDTSETPALNEGKSPGAPAGRGSAAADSERRQTSLRLPDHGLPARASSRCVSIYVAVSYVFSRAPSAKGVS